MRVVFLAEGKLAPSSRFRVQQFLPWFEANGIECVVHYGYDENYNKVANTKLGPAYKVLARAKRFVAGLKDARSADVLFIQRPIFPFSPLPEQILQKINPRIVFDVDDAVFLDARGNAAPARSHTFLSIVRASAHYIAGNSYLAAQGKQLAKTTRIPTVIDTNRFVPRTKPASSDRLVIGWIGSATTLWHLDEVMPALEDILARYPHARVRIVANEMPEHLQNRPGFEFFPWSASQEVELLQSFDIGIMPLANLPISLGKCGFKMIQYMAVGIPIVTSPVGANPEILGNGGAGLLAASREDWVSALSHYVEDAAAREESGRVARARAETIYSVDAAGKKYLSVFKSVAKAGR